MSFGPFDKGVSEFAKVIGRPDDQARMLIIFFAAYPIAYIYRFLHGRMIRHFYSIILGIFLHVFMFREGAIHYWALGLVVYLIMTFMNRRTQAPVVLVV